MDFGGSQVYVDESVEPISSNAKSILLTEDNLVTMRFESGPPDLIQNLPSQALSSGMILPDATYESNSIYSTPHGLR